MKNSVDIHQIFADYFDDELIKKLAYDCSKILEEGQICIDFKDFTNRNHLSITENDLLKNKWVGTDCDTQKAFILHQHQIYLQRYFLYESELVEKIQQLISVENIKEKQSELLSIQEHIKEMFSNEKADTDWQLIASINAYCHHFSLITGGPGTGKTTTIAKLLSLIYAIKLDAKVAFAAPTGKASARMKESLLNAKNRLSIPNNIQKQFEQIQNFTIHRLLGSQKGTHYFKHNQHNPLAYDWVIIDESSMIGISLFSKLLQAIPPSCQVVLLGDKHQLSSVEAGSVFGDICNSLGDGINTFSEKECAFLNQFNLNIKASNPLKNNLMQGRIVELNKNYRFESNSTIGNFSQAILSNPNQLKPFFKLRTEDFELFRDFNTEEIQSYFVNYKAYIQTQTASEALCKFKQFRILCPANIGKLGVNELNRLVEKYLSSQKLISNSHSNAFYEHLPIIIQSNDYQLGLFNGDIGIVRKDKNGQLKVYFEQEDGRIKSINPYLINDYAPAYAMSIHKSQGSEFEHTVIIIPPNTNENLLNKELIYTAVTRAKNRLTLFSTETSLTEACNKTLKKATNLEQQLKAMSKNYQ